MNTIPQAIECPQCKAPLSLAAGRRHCQCAYCGSKFVVDGSGGESPHLTRFESIVATALDGAAAQDAYQRLADVEIAIADAEDEVELKRAELAQAKSAYLETRAQVQKAIAPAQNPT